MKYVAFDIEIARPVHGDDWEASRPLGISCAATLTDEGKCILWKGATSDFPQHPDQPYLPRMTTRQVTALAAYLSKMHYTGFKIITWNGLGFDFDILAEECRDRDWARECANLAMLHVDVAFQMLTEMGYMIGLETCARGLGLEGKTEGMHGDLAPILWNGSTEPPADCRSRRAAS